MLYWIDGQHRHLERLIEVSTRKVCLHANDPLVVIVGLFDGGRKILGNAERKAQPESSTRALRLGDHLFRPLDGLFSRRPVAGLVKAIAYADEEDQGVYIVRTVDGQLQRTTNVTTQRSRMRIQIDTQAAEPPPTQSLADGYDHKKEAQKSEGRKQEHKERAHVLFTEKGKPANGDPESVPDERDNPVCDELPARAGASPPFRPARPAQQNALNLISRLAQHGPSLSGSSTCTEHLCR